MSDLCDEYSEDADALCVRQCGHDGLHQSRVCDGTCDTCDCYEWPNDGGDAGGGPMRVIVCGGRTYGVPSNSRNMTEQERAADSKRASRERAHVWQTLGTMEPEITEIAHGGAEGADMCAGNWAHAAAIPCLVFRADWSLHGRAAGPIRNAQMLREFAPDAVIAFPGGRGTADMIRQARAAGVRVIEIPHSAEGSRHE